MLILEGAQTGLNGETILKKRLGYRKMFHDFDLTKVAKMTEKALEMLLDNAEIIRNRLKIYSARQNARIFLNIQKEFGNFAVYVWRFVNNQPRINHGKHFKSIPTKTSKSDVLSKNLKKK